MHQHSKDQAVSFLIPLMERESEPVYIFYYIFYMFWVLASLANLHMHMSLLRTSILKVIILSSEYFIVQNSVNIQQMSEVIGAYCRRDLLDYSSITKNGM